jgi:hypothetical protein
MAMKQSRASTERYLLRLKACFYLNFWRIHLFDDVSFDLFLLYRPNKDTEKFCEKYSLVSTHLLFLKNKLLSSIWLFFVVLPIVSHPKKEGKKESQVCTSHQNKERNAHTRTQLSENLSFLTHQR